MRKGSIMNVLPMLGVFIAAMLFLFQSFPINQAFGDELTESISDLDRLSRTNSVADLYLYNQVPMAASYAVHNSSYEVAQNGGSIGLDYVKWNYTKLRERSMYGNFRNTIWANLYTTAQPRFKNEYLRQPDSLGDCSMDLQGFSMSVKSYGLTKDTLGIAGTVNPGGKLEANCNSSQGSTNYQTSYVLVNYNASDNRFFQLSDDTVSFFMELGDRWSSDVKDSYTGSARACGFKDYESAEQSAVNSAESDIETVFSQVNASYPTYEGFKLKKSHISTNTYTFNHGSTSSVFNATQSQSFSSIGDCDCETCYNDLGLPYDCNCDTEYKAKVTVKPDQSQVKWVLEDSKYRIPTQEGWKNLNFKVDGYLHDFQND